MPRGPSLAETHPELAAQADGWDPYSVSAKSQLKVKWKGKCSHSWVAEIKSRGYGAGCPVCAGQLVQIGFNDLATTLPELAIQADGWDPTTVTKGSKLKKQWKCEIGHTWIASVGARSGGTGCPVCSNRKILVGYNDLATTNPKIAAQADGWDPTLVSKGHNKKKQWRCSLGHSYFATVNQRSHHDTGCPICAGKKVLIGFNDLATTRPDLAAEADGWDPTSVTRGSNRKVKWRCLQGHNWKTSPTDRLRGEGCPTCSKSGFDPNKEGWLYLVYHEEWDQIQVGLTNSPENRLIDHRRTGFDSVLDIRGPMEGAVAQDLERKILHALKKRQAKFSNISGSKKFDGYSEAWTKQSLNVNTISQMIGWVYEDEGVNND